MSARSYLSLIVTLCIAVTVSCCATRPAAAAEEPVRWDGNGHYYEIAYSPEKHYWYEARDAATERTFKGVSGHLMTITSPEENRFLLDNVFPDSVTDDTAAWLGAWQDPTNQGAGNNWHWVTGEPWEWTNWAPDEPWDFLGRNEMYLITWSDNQWNDGWDIARTHYYTVEYPVPEPATAALVLAGVVVLRRRFGRR